MPARRKPGRRPQGWREKTYQHHRPALTPELSLWCAVLEVAVADVRSGVAALRSTKGDKDNRYHAMFRGQRAARWFRDPSPGRRDVLEAILHLELSFVLRQLRKRFGNDFDRLADLGADEMLAISGRTWAAPKRKKVLDDAARAS